MISECLSISIARVAFERQRFSCLLVSISAFDRLVPLTSISSTVKPFSWKFRPPSVRLSHFDTHWLHRFNYFPVFSPLVLPCWLLTRASPTSRSWRISSLFYHASSPPSLTCLASRCPRPHLNSSVGSDTQASLSFRLVGANGDGWALSVRSVGLGPPLMILSELLHRSLFWHRLRQMCASYQSI